ncbi:MAG: hypothetical protein A2X49_06160 [Lentisphaerae bacterium GWF2_52_8]|nr:MAG: hypothetical protein A2X49_06160 [Lentisphaerae bacterium GWF2_52_8]
MSKILMTGITGLVGSAFATALLQAAPNVKLVALSRGRGTRSAADRVAEALREQCAFDGAPGRADAVVNSIQVIDGDIAEISHFSKDPRLAGVDTIFHCAADVNLGKDPDGKTFENNYQGTKNVLALAHEMRIKAFHYVSTAYVAGKLKGTAPEDGLLAEDFYNSYEKSKFLAETIVRESGIPFAIYRPSIVVGRLCDGRIRKPLAFYRLLDFLGRFKSHRCSKLGLKSSSAIEMPLRLEAMPSEHVYFVPVDYVQDTITKIFLMPVCNRTYHITGDSPVSTKAIEEVVTDVLKVTGVKVQAVVDNPSMDEKLVHRFLGDLLPYFSSQAVFDVKNVREAFNNAKIPWTMDINDLKVLVRGYYKESFPELVD